MLISFKLPKYPTTNMIYNFFLWTRSTILTDSLFNNALKIISLTWSLHKVQVKDHSTCIFLKPNHLQNLIQKETKIQNKKRRTSWENQNFNW